MMAFFIIFIIILCLIIGLGLYAANFFLNAALLRHSSWYDTQGHKMMNPDNFKKEKSHYDLVEEEQVKAGDQFWAQNFGQDIWLETEKGKLYARSFTPNPASHQWVICVHGYRSSGKRDMSYVATQFAAQGYNVLVPDLFAHGKSDGEIIGMGWLDRLDLLKWIAQLLELDNQAEIILFGGSMGAATVMMASGESLPKNVKGLIVDCGYSSVYDEFKAMLQTALKLPPFPILTFANLLAKKKAGFFLKEADATKQLAKNDLPTLFIHGTGDKFVPHQMIYRNMEPSKGVKESLIIENAPHLSSFIYEPEHYFGTVFEFIQRYC